MKRKREVISETQKARDHLNTAFGYLDNAVFYAEDTDNIVFRLRELQNKAHNLSHEITTILGEIIKQED